MKKMTIVQKFRLILQSMRMRWTLFFVYLFISIFPFVFGIELKIINPSVLTYVIVFIVIVLIHFFAHVIELLGIIINNVDLVDGFIDKSYDDSPHAIRSGGDGRNDLGSYKKKYISLFSDKVKSRSVPAHGFIRIKVKSFDEKYVSPWIYVTKNIFKNKDKYDYKVIVYKNEAVTAYYQKK